MCASRPCSQTAVQGVEEIFNLRSLASADVVLNGGIATRGFHEVCADVNRGWDVWPPMRHPGESSPVGGSNVSAAGLLASPLGDEITLAGTAFAVSPLARSPLGSQTPQIPSGTMAALSPDKGSSSTRMSVSPWRHDDFVFRLDALASKAAELAQKMEVLELRDRKLAANGAGPTHKVFQSSIPAG